MIKKMSLTAAAAALVVGLTGVAGASVEHRPAAPRPSAAPASASPADNLNPGPYQHALDPLVGTWKAVKTNYILGGGKPIISHDITVTTGWITKTGGRFLEEKTEGTLGANHYYRLGILGFSNIDHRYEWTTFDSVTPTAMTYRGNPVTTISPALSIPGEFTDPGVLGPQYLGKT
ncbi:DUF1579 family protein, partial [Actinoallomurus sp. NPDC050550]|uniref:DUF1579 family protein n=1 Tax=Actinoallomurus sp. NPDC050550 TaxID=3154937 RepID=UPI0033EBBE78